MLIETRLLAIAEQLQQLVSCNFACFLPGSTETSLSHPLLDFLPNIPNVCTDAQLEHIFLDAVWSNEHIQALCDRALVSGHVQVWPACWLQLEQWCLRSLVCVPIERPAGVFGVFLCADERAGQFERGEERLLSAGLAHYAWLVETAYHEYAGWLIQQVWTSVVNNQGWLMAQPAFVSLVGHELRTPLSVIKGYAGLLQMYGYPTLGQETHGDLAQQQKYIQAILEQTHYLEMLLNDLLDFSLLQHSKLPVHPTSVDITALCHQIIQFGQLRARQQTAGTYQFSCDLEKALPPVWADADRLRQVLQNVMENAVKYSPQGGRIVLEARCSAPRGDQDAPTQVSLTIRDQGIGIPKHQMTRIWQPFERLEQPTTSSILGYGLGLYIARALVEAMGGTLGVQSCAGRGTDVTIHLSSAETAVQVSSVLS